MRVRTARTRPRPWPGTACVRTALSPIFRPEITLPRMRMNTAAIATFVLTGGFVWGGFLLILFTAAKKERGKGAE